MKIKIIVAAVLVVVAVAFGANAFVETTVEYSSFAKAESQHKKVQVKGDWLSEKGSSYDPKTNLFAFVMRDESGTEMPVVYEGAKPNNFELAQMIVVKGRCENGVFKASEILTKCPSKYEADTETVKKTL